MPQRTLGITIQARRVREFITACENVGPDMDRRKQSTLKRAGDLVRRSATVRFAPIDVRSARGYRTLVHPRGVVVQQSIPRTTGLRPDYGALQMREALLPALAQHADEIQLLLDRETGKAMDKFERSP